MITKMTLILISNITIKAPQASILIGTSLADIGTNIQTQVTGLVLGAIVAFFAFQVLKSMGSNNITKVVVTIILGVLVYFAVANFAYLSGIFGPILKSILGE